MKNILEMNFMEFSSMFGKISEEEINDLFIDNKIMMLDIKIFKALFLRSSDEIKKKMIDNINCFERIIDLQKKEKSIFRIIHTNNIEIFKYLLESPNAEHYFDLINSYLMQISSDKLYTLNQLIDLNKMYKSSLMLDTTEDIENFVNTFDYIKDKNLKNSLIHAINNSKVNINLLSRTKNENEIYILVNYGIYVKCDSDYEDIVLANGEVIPKKIIESIKPKYIIHLINDMSKIEKFNAELFLELAIKLYIVFDFDDAKKIVNHKFSFLTKNANIRIANFNFKDSRREFRFNNQSMFYYHNLDSDIRKSIDTKDYFLITELLGNNDPENIENFIIGFKECNTTEETKNYLNSVINKREDAHRNNFLKTIHARLDAKKEKTSIEKSIDYRKMVFYLENLDLNKIFSYTKEEKESLSTTLLGNKKNDNDSLFRILLNDEGFGLRINFLINKYSQLKKLAKKSNVSMNSVLDLIELSKIDLYNITPDCRDVYLNTFVKITSSKKFIVNSEVDVFAETVKLHNQRKYKVKSTIPTVSGKKDGFKYQIAPFDSEYLLSLGVDTDSCMRFGGLGEDFFKYILLNPNGAMLILTDSLENKYYCPLVRSGNTININGIEPKVENEELDKVLSILKVACDDILSRADAQDNLNAVTVSDLHLKGKKLSDKTVELEESIPLKETMDKDYIYTDYNKEEMTHFVISEKDFEEVEFFKPVVNYYQDRISVYEYNSKKEYDAERLNILINSINYSSIEYFDIPNKAKNSLRRKYTPIDATSFLYIVGSRDWYIAVDKNFNVIAKILPYDPRAKIEYFERFGHVTKIAQELAMNNEVVIGG